MHGYQNRTGPAGSTGWTGNRPDNRFGRPRKLVAQKIGQEPAKTGQEPVQKIGLNRPEPVFAKKNYFFLLFFFNF